jgi:hypothetical protein
MPPTRPPSIAKRKETQGLCASNKRPGCFNCSENAQGICVVGEFEVGEHYSGWCPSWTPHAGWIAQNPIAYAKLS